MNSAKIGQIAIIAAFLLAPLSVGCAQREQTVTETDRFAIIDTNKDGKITVDEFKANFPNMNEQAFIVIDKNGDKGIDRAEWLEFVETHGQSQREMGAPMNNIPGDPLIPPPDSSDLPLMRPPSN